jgi:hypothetical protein
LPDYTIDPIERVLDWLSVTADPERRDALLRWTRAAMIDPGMVTHGELIPQHRRSIHRVYFSDIPGANTRVSFIVVDLPVRCIRILAIDDASYGLPPMPR